jgi:hypothetical protein
MLYGIVMERLQRTVWLFFFYAVVVSVAGTALRGVSVAHAAFGISPPFLHAENLIKGSRYVQTIYLVQDQPNEDLPIEVALEISERVRSWITVDTGFNFIIPKNERQFPVRVIIQVPKNAELGAYNGRLTFTSKPGKAGQVTIALGAQVAINMTVGTNIYRKFTVPVVKPLDIEEGWNPRVYVKFNNEGNVPEAFDGGTFELQDQYGAVRLAYAQEPLELPETPPFTIHEYVVEFPIDFHLGLGQYWGSVSFYKNEKVVASQRTVFRVLNTGSLSGPVAILGSSPRKTIIYGGIVAVFLGIVVFLARRRFRRTSYV